MTGDTAERRRQAAPPLSVGSVRNVSILFADIVGSTRMIRFMDAEDARDALDDTLRLVTDGVRALGGSVARVQGDGVMAIFGMLAMTEDHALRAALAACHIRDNVATHVTQGRKTGDLQVRIGIHSGPILLRWLEDDFGRILDAVGATAHVAGQVEQNCPPGSVAISGAALAMIDEPADVRPLLTLSAAETGEALDILELKSIDLARADLLPVKGKAALPLFGREAAMDKVRRAMRSAASNAPLAIVGEAGMGKSRLLNEAALLAEQSGHAFAAVRGNAILRDVPFGALIPCLRHLIELADANLDNLSQSTGLSDAEAACIASLLGKQAQEVSALPPDERNRQIKGAATQLIATSSRQRMALLIDDVQVLDIETLDFIESLVRSEAIESLYLVAAGRPEAADWLTRIAHESVELAPLDAEQSGRLIGAILGSGEANQALAAKIVERSGGLPLALEEFANFALGTSADELAIDPDLPPRLESLFLSRMNDLDADAVDVCVHCSALGTVVPLAQLRQIGLMDEARFDRAMQSLLDNRILEADLGGRITFSHQLVQEATYHSLGRKRRSAVHASIYRALSDGDAALMPLQSELARHAEMAGSYEAALQHLRKAGQDAIAIAAIEAVHAIYRRAKAICAKMGESGQPLASQFALLAYDSMQQLSFERELHDDVLAIVERKVELSNDAIIIATVHLATLCWVEGRTNQAETYAKQALAMLEGRDSVPMHAFANFALATIAFNSGRPREALARMGTICDLLAEAYKTATFGATISIPGILARSFGAWYASDLGEFAVAEKYAAFVLDYGEKLQHDYSRMLSRLATGYLQLRKGEPANAVTTLREALELSLQKNFMGLEATASSWLALALIEMGDITEASAVIAKSRKLGNYVRVQINAPYFLLEAEARLCAARGDAHESNRLLDAAIALAEGQNDPVVALLGHTARVELASALAADPDTTAQYKAQAMKAAKDMGLSGILGRLAAA